MSELEQFLNDTGAEEKKVDIMDQPLVPEQGTAMTDTDITTSDDGVDPSPKNRRERRLMAKLEAERESSIKLADSLSRLTESQKFSQESEGEYLKAVERIYGNQTPDAAAATELLKKAMTEVKEAAKKEALDEFRSESSRDSQALSKEEKALDAMVEDIEDVYDVDFNDNTKKAFFTLLERMSPKDADGNVSHYADHYAVWDVLQSRVKAKTDTRARDASSRSMTVSGSSTDGSKNAAESFLRDNGLI